MSSLDDLIAILGDAVERLRQAVAHAQAAREMAEDLRDHAAAMGVYGVADRFTGIADSVEELLGMLAGCIASGEQLVAQVDGIKHGGSPAVGGTGAAPVVVSPSGAAGTPTLTSANLGEILRRLPVRPRDKGPTRGQAFDETGQPLGEPIRSSRNDSLLDDLDLPYPARLSDALSSHVEVKVAAMMRHGQAPQHVSVVINNANGPCGWLERQRGEPPTGFTCDDWLADIMPADSTMTVRWRDHQGWGRRAVYRGTGRRIKP